MIDSLQSVEEKFTAKNLIADPAELVSTYPAVPITVDCLIFGFDNNELKILLIRSDLKMYEGEWSLLGDFAHDDEELDDAANRVLKERTGMTDVYLEQVRTFSRPDRHPGGRVLTVAYCSLLNIQHHKLNILDNELHWHSVSSIRKMAFDHKQILDYSYSWLQKRIMEHPLGLSLLPEKFSLRELQTLYESILDIKFDRRNFRKKFFSMDFLIDTGEYENDVPHRPGKLYCFDYKKYNISQRRCTALDF